jgi:predicted nucleic acid-binding protein
VDRVFLDANVLFSAAYRPNAGLARLWTISHSTLIASSYAIEEARRNLDQPEQKSRLDELTRQLEIIDDKDVVGELVLDIELPAKDWPILWAAISAHATHLLTGDLQHFGPYMDQTIAGVRVMLPADYMGGK